jgi:hypothetical protein
VDEVHIGGSRRPIGSHVLSGDEGRSLPGAFGDPLRTVDLMPGVVPVVSGLPFFYVRGAPPGNTGYFIDGVRVPLVFHLAVGQSVVHPALIDRVDFYPGGYPARFGRFLGGIVDAQTRGDAPAPTVQGNLRLLDVGGLAETPFDDSRGSAVVAGRYGYPGLLLALFAPDTRLSYWDYQTRVRYRAAPHETVSAWIFGSFDDLDTRDTSSGPFYPLVRTTFHRADLSWDYDVPGGTLRTAVTLGFDDSIQSDSAVSNRRVEATSVQARTLLDRALSWTVRLNLGADAIFSHYDYPGLRDVGGVGVPMSCPSGNDDDIGAHAEVAWRMTPRVEIVPGARFDVYTSRPVAPVDPVRCIVFVVGDRPAAAVALDPRLAVRAQIAPRVSWVSALGLVHSPPTFVLGAPGLEIGSIAHGLQSGLQTSHGVETHLPLDTTLGATFFFNSYFGLTDAVATCSTNGVGSSNLGCLDARTSGRSFGGELLLRRSFSSRLGGWVSYTLSHSTVELQHPSPGASEAPASFDRPHVLNSAVSFDLGAGWHAGGRFTYYSGVPFTAEVGGLAVGPTTRLPDFWRIDVRLEKRWLIASRWHVAAVLEGMNVTLNKEAIGANCTGATTASCTPKYVGPVSAPSLGVEVAE